MNRMFFKLIVIISCICLTVASCREDSDDIRSYVYEDSLNFAEAKSSLTGQFKAIWTAMNCNYPIWDYEEQQGLNWDDVYDEFLPRFMLLDKKYNKQNPVPDSLLRELYTDLLSPLHDGHLMLYLQNIHTGKSHADIYKYSVSPQLFRNLKTYEYIKPTLKYYNDSDKLKEYYAEKDDAENEYIYACFKDNIVYFRLPVFNLTETLKNRSINENSERIYSLWESWFNCIQNLYSSNSLKGVVIDLRNNPGGSADDYQYVLGALHGGNNEYDNLSHTIGYIREKNGIGRLDFSRLSTFALRINKNHVPVKAPIVVLVNSFSASMAEITCISAKQLKNGYVIGAKTYGAFSPLSDSYAMTYSGSVGDPTLADYKAENGEFFAPFYIYMPSCAFFSIEHQIIDGAGIEPDEIVHLDYLNYIDGRDNQIERALEYIREKGEVSDGN